MMVDADIKELEEMRRCQDVIRKLSISNSKQQKNVLAAQCLLYSAWFIDTDGSYRGYKDLKVFQLSYKLAMDIFEITKTFPIEERYSLTDQIRRSSRSIPTNISEAWKKRLYPKMFVSKIVDAAGEAGETEVWLDISKDSGYLPVEKYEELGSAYDEVNRMLYGMIEKPEKFCTFSSKKNKHGPQYLVHSAQCILSCNGYCLLPTAY